MKAEDLFKKHIIEYLAGDGHDMHSLARLLGVEKLTIKSWLCGEVVPHSSIKEPIERIIQEDIANSANKRAM